MKCSHEDKRYLDTVLNAIDIYICLKCKLLHFSMRGTFLTMGDLIDLNNTFVGWLWKNRKEYKIPMVDLIKKIPFIKRKKK